jgi:hypothetical protein
MIGRAMKLRPELAAAARWPALPRQETRIAAVELTVLVAAGLAAAVAWLWLQPLKLQMPGWAILRGVLPMTVGLGLVPRRGSATVMSATACLACIAGGLAGLAHVQAAPMVSLFLLGPLLDAAAAKASSGWRLYAWFAAAGLTADLVAFAVRVATAYWLIEPGVHKRFLVFWPTALASYLACGAVAGLLCAAVCFRFRRRDA